MGADCSCVKKVNTHDHQIDKIMTELVHNNDEQHIIPSEMKDNQSEYKAGDNTTDKHNDASHNSTIVIDVELQNSTPLKNIISYLKYYQTILNDVNYNDLLCEYFDENKNILEDYAYILKQYLNNEPNKNNETFEQIYNIISKEIKCDIKNCKQYSRNNRNREKESQKPNNQKSSDKNDQFKILFITDLFDTIHCYFLHSFDIGFRMKHSELTQIYNHSHNDKHKNTIENVQDLDNKSALNIHINDNMKTFNSYIRNKRQSLMDIRGANRAKNNKFMTSVNENTLLNNEEKDENENENKLQQETEDKMDSFSFGYRYYYWKQNKFRERWYIPKTMSKHNSLKDEILNNKIFKLSFESYNIAIEKAKHYINCKYIKQCKTNDALCQYYGIIKYSTMSMEHIISLILYTDFDQLSYHFSSTFRRQKREQDKNKSMSVIHKQVKQRNAQYWYWSKALRETVELWGVSLNSHNNKVDVFYHGTSYLIFDKLVAKFSSPTSTTSSIQVATIFAKENGIILELEKYEGYGSYLRYFNVNFISAFSNEDEKLFFGGKRQLRLGAIRNIETNENYRMFIRALTIFQIAIKGMNNTVIKNCTKADFSIIDRLCKHKQNGGIYKDYMNKFPEYVNKLFKLFSKNQVSIAFNFGNIKKKYNGIIRIIGFVDLKGLLKFDYLLQTFTNCQYITIIENPSKPFIITFTTNFANKLLQICVNINQNNNTNIKTILYKSCIEIVDNFDKNKYEQMFADNNWTLLLEQSKTRYTNYKNNLYNMTLKKGYSGSKVDKVLIKKAQQKRMKVMNYFDDNDVHLNRVAKINIKPQMMELDVEQLSDDDDIIEPYDNDKMYNGKIEPPMLFGDNEDDDSDDMYKYAIPNPANQMKIENNIQKFDRVDD